MLFHVLWCYLLVFHYGLGIKGASIATCITYWLNLSIVTAFLSFKSGIVPKDSWHFFNRDSFRGWKEYLYFGIPSALMICMEWWCFELLSFFAGMLSVNELAANILLLNLIGSMFQIPLGMSFSISNLVGNSLGEGKPRKARKYFIASLLVTIAILIVQSILLLTLRDYVPMLYTKHEDVINFVVHTIPVFSALVIFDFIQTVEAGSVRAIGYQTYGSWVSFISYWIISLPVSYFLAFNFELRLTGIWLGVVFGNMFATVTYLCILLYADWHKLAESIHLRIQKEKSNQDKSLINEPS